MQETTKYLCENIQGCVLGYTQSDEISLVLVDYQKLTSDAWFDYEVQKLCSISASMATMAFNKYFVTNYLDYINTLIVDFSNENEKITLEKFLLRMIMLVIKVRCLTPKRLMFQKKK